MNNQTIITCIQSQSQLNKMNSLILALVKLTILFYLYNGFQWTVDFPQQAVLLRVQVWVARQYASVMKVSRQLVIQLLSARTMALGQIENLTVPVSILSASETTTPLVKPRHAKNYSIISVWTIR